MISDGLPNLEYTTCVRLVENGVDVMVLEGAGFSCRRDRLKCALHKIKGQSRSFILSDG